MAATTFDELKKQIEARVKKALVEDVAEVVKENESDAIEELVYTIYSDPPVEYDRRMRDGGLSDPKNMKVRALGNRIEVYNNTPLNPDYPNDKAYSLDLLVEYGDRGPGGEYLYKTVDPTKKPEGPTYLLPRPFTKVTVQTLRANKQHVNALRYGLMRSGAKVKNG